MGHYVELFRIVRKVDGCMNKKNETLRNVQPWHNARSSEVSHNIKNTKQTQKEPLSVCFDRYFKDTLFLKTLFFIEV